MVPELPRHAAERALAREGKRERGKIRYHSPSQRRAVPSVVRLTEPSNPDRQGARQRSLMAASSRT
ncbi:hypothetical protein K270103H11_04570 [Gordonibacter urolithinfaciens]